MGVPSFSCAPCACGLAPLSLSAPDSLACCQIFAGLHVEEADGSFSELQLVDCKCVDTYVTYKKNQNQVSTLPSNPTTLPHAQTSCGSHQIACLSLSTFQSALVAELWL